MILIIGVIIFAALFLPMQALARFFNYFFKVSYVFFFNFQLQLEVLLAFL